MAPGPLSRRSFLSGAMAVAAGGLAVACGRGSDAEAPTSAAGAASPSTNAVDFFGEHQAGIVTPPPRSATMVALDATASTVAAVTGGFRALSDEVRALTDVHDDVGAVNAIVAVGPSLFDERYGLAARRPSELVAMPRFANDELDPTRTHGDVLVTVSGDDDTTTAAAIQRVVGAVDGVLAPRWTVSGFNERSADEAHARNLMGFLDGTSNPDITAEAPMRQFVWVRPRDDEPEWAAGGSYMAVRVIRMLLDDWEGTGVADQEAIIGRRKASGAPLGGGTAADVPDYVDDHDGAVTPLTAHIRLANPRDTSIEYDSILRRGFSYDRGRDAAGRLDAGLAFVSFQRSLDKGFLAIQARLAGEPLEQFTRPQGGGFFFALPGVRDEDDWLGRTLLHAA